MSTLIRVCYERIQITSKKTLKILVAVNIWKRKRIVERPLDSTWAEVPLDFLDLKKQVPCPELPALEFSGKAPSDGVTASGRWWRLRSLLDGELVELLAASCSEIFSEDRKNFRNAATTFSLDLVDMANQLVRFQYSAIGMFDLQETLDRLARIHRNPWKHEYPITNHSIVQVKRLNLVESTTSGAIAWTLVEVWRLSRGA